MKPRIRGIPACLLFFASSTLLLAGTEPSPIVTSFGSLLHGISGEFASATKNNAAEVPLLIYVDADSSPSVNGAVYAVISGESLRKVFTDVQWNETVSFRVLQLGQGDSKDVTSEISISRTSELSGGQGFITALIDFELTFKDNQTAADKVYEIRAVFNREAFPGVVSVSDDVATERVERFRLQLIRTKEDRLNLLRQTILRYESQMNVYLPIVPEEERNEVQMKANESRRKFKASIDVLLKEVPDDVVYLYKRAQQEQDDRAYANALRDFRRIVEVLKSEAKIRALPAIPVRCQLTREQCVALLNFRIEYLEKQQNPGNTHGDGDKEDAAGK